MPDLSRFRAAAPADRAPLRRAAALGALLVVLLVAGKAFGPSRAAAAAPAERQDLQAAAEPLSARSDAPSGPWTAGRMAAVGLLVVGAGAALVLRRRRETTAAARTRLDVLESRPLGAGHSLQLVGCGDEVLLLSVGPEGARMLRHWPRAAVEGTADAPAAPFADLLAEATADARGPEPDPDPPLVSEEKPPEAAAPEPVAPEPVAPEPVAAPEPVEPVAVAEPVAEPRAEPASVVRPTVARGALFPSPSRGLPQFGAFDA